MSSTIKTLNVNVTAFRDNLKGYLEKAETDMLIINGKHGKRYLVAALDDIEESYEKALSKFDLKINKKNIENG
jgi:hypothetical protein